MTSLLVQEIRNAFSGTGFLRTRVFLVQDFKDMRFLIQDFKDMRFSGTGFLRTCVFLLQEIKGMPFLAQDIWRNLATFNFCF